jgi:para-aminobenzoate synthetase
VSTLLIDNYDSYTYNVFHLLAAVSGEEPMVVRNDAVSWRALSRWDFDAIVISPGPGRPERWHDFGVCSDILRSSEVPVLGVCLGHQGLGHLLSGAVSTAPIAMHGRLSRVQHSGSGLFDAIPQDFSVVRYHSLAVTGDLGPEGRVIAWTPEGVVMGIEHTSRPLWGVQFHPESIATEYGHKLFENFYTLAREHNSAHARHPASRRTPPSLPSRAPAPRVAAEQLELRVRSFDGEPSTELMFERLFGSAEHAFWLDSSAAPTSLAQSSFLGTTAGTDRCVLEYDVEQGIVTSHHANGTTTESASIFDVLERKLGNHTSEPPPGLPPGLLGGFVGYLGYECKADCGSPNIHQSDLPDAVMMFANRVVAVDYVTHRTHLLAVCHGDGQEAEHWLDDAEAVLRALLGDPPVVEATSPADGRSTVELPGDQSVSFRCGRGRAQYLADIARCQTALTAGDSYEVCLTDQLHTDASPDPFALYRVLRRRNPAPFAAYLKLGELAVLSSSPERFLSIDSDRHVQARPIKGTSPRSSDLLQDAAARDSLQNDEKTFAEHLMIVDLLRNDLGGVCKLGSIGVPELMAVESYVSVHQLVSTITGVLEHDRSPLSCVRACFPGGSMTGAPKLRTMEIIDDIECEARGVYAGALGYFGLDGSVDLSIVIRTIVMQPGATTIGAGGAIVMQSDPEGEFDELLLKARAPMSAIAQAVTGRDSPDAWTVELEPTETPAVSP